MAGSQMNFRFERKGGFTVLTNGVLRDPRLSLKTKGLFAVISSLPEDWRYSVSGLASYCGVGRDAIRSALKELEAAGYLTREQLHGERGKFGGNAYVLREESVLPLPGFPSTGNPTLQKKEKTNTPIVPRRGTARRGSEKGGPTNRSRTGNQSDSLSSGSSTREGRTNRRPSGPGTSSGQRTA